MVNNDGWDGTAPDPLVRSAGAHPQEALAGSCGSGPGFFAWPPGIWDSGWVNVPASVICAEDVAHWPYTTGLMVKWVSFLGSVHWPAGGLDLGVGGVSYVELFNLYELWAGEMLSFEKAVPRCLRPGRPISVSAVPFGPSIDIWRSCRLIGAMMTSLCFLPGGLGRFVPCSIGANHCRLRHIWWEKCGHGLASRPRESSSELFLNEVLGLFRYPPGSGRAFACMTTTRRLPVSGHVVDLVAANVGAAQEVIADGACQEVYWVSSSGPGRKRTRLNRKKPRTPRGIHGSVSSTSVEEVASCWAF